MLLLRALTLDDLEQVRQWRNSPEVRMGLRTPYLLTAEMQAAFYRDVVCNRSSPHRYWALVDGEGSAAVFVGMVGLTGIQWENGLAEISLITAPGQSGKGYGLAGVRLVLHEAFDVIRLETVVGECYTCNNPALGFWQTLVERASAHAVTLPQRKWYAGRLWDSYVFTFTRAHRP